MISEVDQFLEDIKGDKKQSDPFVIEETDPLAPKESEKTVVEDKGTDDKGDDKPLPFHKDPKVQRYIDKEISKRIKETPNAGEPINSNQAKSDELMESLVEIVGNDTPQKVAAVNKLYKSLGNLREEGARQALEQIRQQGEAEEAEVAEATEELESAFESIEEEFDVDLSNTTAARKERNDFIEFIKKVAPKDRDGDVIAYPDITETYKLFQQNKKPIIDNKRAKDISTRSMQRSSDATSTPTTGKTWKDVDRIFGKLST